MFVMLPILSYVLRHALEAWRQFRRDAANRREWEGLDECALRDLGVSHRCAIPTSVVDLRRSPNTRDPFYWRIDCPVDLRHIQGSPEDRTSQ
jgi:hypothetical protein